MKLKKHSFFEQFYFMDDNSLSEHSLQSNSAYELRCRFCDKLLGKHAVHKASIEIKCVRCGNINSILDDAGTVVIITGRDGNIIYANEQVEPVTGYKVEEVLGKTPAIWGKQMSEEFYRQLWEDISVKKRAVTVNLTNKKKDGSIYQCVNRISPILNEAGEVKYFLGIQSIVK